MIYGDLTYQILIKYKKKVSKKITMLRKIMYQLIQENKEFKEDQLNQNLQDLHLAAI